MRNSIYKIWLSLYTWLLDFVVESEMFSDFYFRKFAKGRLADRANSIFELMLKIYLIQNPPDIELWIKDVNHGFDLMISDVALAGGNRPTKEILYLWFNSDVPTHFDIRDVENNIVRWISYDSTIVLRETNREEVLIEVLAIVKEACGFTVANWDDYESFDIRNYLSKEIYQREPDAK